MQNSLLKVFDGYNYKTMCQDLSNLYRVYPLFEVENIGKSVLGRSIPAIRLGTGPRNIHYNGSFHANEWITTILLMLFIEKCLQAYQKGQNFEGVNIYKLFKEKSLWIVPMVNPDGVELVQNGFIADNNPYYREVLRANRGSTNFSTWKANIRGVDLNDQFPAFWEKEYSRRNTSGPAPLNYPGPYPLSEPEAKAIAHFTRKHDFELVIAFHTQGEEIYWGYRQMEPSRAKTIVRKMSRASNYKTVRYVDSDAGYKDWFIYEWRKPGFTVECGKGVNPLPLSQLSSIWPQVCKIMLIGLECG
ncbi:MAG: M14 family metallopeptidase [Desulfitobacteriia bacterium]|jgi:g-D-glutamyl-meso-diaminopimelate peptidase